MARQIRSARELTHDLTERRAFAEHFCLKNTPSRDATMLIAQSHAALGEGDQAFAWLEKAYQRRVSPLTSFHIDPGFDKLRGDPRFDELRRRIGLP